MATRGRKTKYTPEIVKLILDAISVGTPYRYAAAYAGISEDTFAAWREKYPDFSDSIKNAEAKALTARLARIVKASEETWQAAAWWAERKYPQEFGKTVSGNVNLTGDIIDMLREFGRGD